MWHAIHFRNGACRVALDDQIEQNSELLASHRMVKELTKSRRHACPQCDYKTGNVSDLRTHVRTVHEQRRDHACPQCDAAFGEASSLSRHVRTVHKQPPPMPLPVPPHGARGAAVVPGATAHF